MDDGILERPATPLRPGWLPEGDPAAVIAAFDWAGTPLGPLEDWPLSLRTVLGTILRAPGPMTVLWGERGHAIYNDAYAAILGAQHPAALGQSVFDSFPDFAELNAHVLQSCLAGEVTSLREAGLRLDRGGGLEPAWFDVDYVPVFGDDGQPAGALAIATEVTARIAAERQSREGEARLMALADNLPGVVVYQLETSADLSERRYAYVSANVVPVLGIEARQAASDPLAWLSLVEPGDHERVLEAERRAARDLSTLELEVRLSRPDGREITARIVSRPRPLPDGGLLWDGMLVDVTGEREAEARHNRTASLLEAIGAATPDLIYAKDRDSRLLYANKALSALIGRPVEALVGVPMAEWAGDSAEAEALRANDLRIMEEGRTVEFEEVFTGADGRTRHFRTVKSPLRDRTGAMVGLMGLSGDVTAARHAEAELRRLNATLEERVAEALAERRLWAEVFEVTEARISVLGLDGRLLAANRALLDATEQAIGRRPQLGERLQEMFAGQDDLLAPIKALWDRALGGEAFTVVNEMGDLALELRFEPMRDAAGQIMAALQFATDVTERLRDQRRAEASEMARREADALHRAYFENSAEYLFVIGVLPDGRFRFEELNPAYTKAIAAFGLRWGIGRPLDEMLPPDLAREVSVNYRRVFETGQIQRYRESFSLEGQTLHFETVLVPVRDAEGRIARIIGSARDMTAQVQAEEALRQSQKLDSMGQLTGGVAHDFNNLLTPIIGSLDMIHRRGLGDERMRRLVDGALQSAERARTLVQRLLAFARRQPLQLVAVDLGALAQGMAALVASTVGPRIRVDTVIEPGLPPVQADANQLEMAILNLAVNARDAMPEGGSLRIEATTKGEPPTDLPRSRRFARLVVADTGIGMDEATLVRAVEPFFSTKGVGRGTGLGLSMVHGLASQLGGALRLRSEPGEGTAVELWLPIATEAAEAETRTPAFPTGAGAGHVLLVDDEDLVRAAAAQMLGELGFSVSEARSSEEALALLRGGLVPDLVVTDHLMPGMTGTVLAQVLRTERPGLPVLLVSGYAEDGALPSDLPRLNKPFRQADLAQALSSLLPR